MKIKTGIETYVDARYIRFDVSNDEPTVYGTMGAGEPEYGEPLKAAPWTKTFPFPPLHEGNYYEFKAENFFERALERGAELLGDNGVLGEIYRLRNCEKGLRHIERSEQEWQKRQDNLTKEYRQLAAQKRQLTSVAGAVEERLVEAKLRNRIADFLEEGDEIEDTLGDVENYIRLFRFARNRETTPHLVAQIRSDNGAAYIPGNDYPHHQRAATDPQDVARMPVPVLTVRNFPSMPDPPPTSPPRTFAVDDDRTADPRALQGGRDAAARTSLPRTGCGYCNNGGHSAFYCFDPHVSCTEERCRVPGDHRHYRPLHRCRAHPYYDASTDRESFLASQRATFTITRGTRSPTLRGRAPSNVRGSRRLVGPPYPRSHPSPSSPLSAEAGPSVRPGPRTNRADGSRGHRSYPARTGVSLPSGVSSADGYPINWGHVERIVANNGWRLNDVSRQMAIDLFPNMIMERALQFRPVRAAERVSPYDWHPGEELDPDYLNVLGDIDIDYEAEDRGG
jgi:hypothetical protein